MNKKTTTQKEALNLLTKEKLIRVIAAERLSNSINRLKNMNSQSFISSLKSHFNEKKALNDQNNSEGRKSSLKLASLKLTSQAF